MTSHQDRWSTLGETNPYFAVCTDRRFRRDRMTDSDRRDFFESGAREVAATFKSLEAMRPGLRPALAIDFGCGVGRLTIPIAKRCGRVVGVDVSAPMLREAERNCAANGVTNASFVESAAIWTALEGASPDMVHAYIVFQHIPTADGMRIAGEMLAKLAPGGVGALHFMHSWRAPWPRRAISALRQSVAPLNAVLNTIQGRPMSEPTIPMFTYSEAEVRALFTANRCEPMTVIRTDHGGFLGAMYMLLKAA